LFCYCESKVVGFLLPQKLGIGIKIGMLAGCLAHRAFGAEGKKKRQNERSVE
jgi:hypothetical protein